MKREIKIRSGLFNGHKYQIEYYLSIDMIRINHGITMWKSLNKTVDEIFTMSEDLENGVYISFSY